MPHQKVASIADGQRVANSYPTYIHTCLGNMRNVTKLFVVGPVPRRARPDCDDEALARRLQEQWISEDSSGRDGLGMFAGADAQVTNVHINKLDPSVNRTLF